MQRRRIVVAVVVAVASAAVALPELSTAQDRILTAILNTNGPWRDAADRVDNELPLAGGVHVTVTSSTDGPPCRTPRDLLVAEAESILRDFGLPVRRTLTGVEVTIDVVSIAQADRCLTVLNMELTMDRLQNVSDLEAIYFGRIVIDDAVVVLTHPASRHRQILRESVNERVTVWANELVQHRPAPTP